MSYFAAGYYGTGYYGPGYWGGGSVTPPVVDDGDTHDGFDEDLPRRVRRDLRAADERFRGARERLRDVLTQAWDGPGPVAAEVKALAAPYVDVLESGALRIDYAAIERRNREVLDGVLAFEAALRAEFAARIAAYEQDEEDVMLLTGWP